MRKHLLAGVLLAAGHAVHPRALLAGPANPATVRDTRLADAAQARNIVLVRTLLKQGANVNQAQGDGMTALHWAAYHDDIELVRTLLLRHPNLQAATRNGQLTPLFLACQNGSVGTIGELLTAGADVNGANATGTTPLMIASAAGSEAAVKLLLERGAQVNARDTSNGQTALMFAAALDRQGVAKLLLQHGAEHAVKTKVKKLERLRVDMDGNVIPVRPGGTSPAKPGESSEAAQDSPAKSKEQPAETAKAVVPAKTGEPTQSAEQAKTAEAAKPVAAAKAAEPAETAKAPAPAGDTGRDGRRGGGTGPARAGDVANLGPREAGITNIGGMSALLFAARDGHLETVRALLDGGADVNLVGEADNSSALVVAITNGHFDVAKLLLERGANPNLTNAAGLGPLFATIDVQWAPKAWYPQPDVSQQSISYLDLITLLLKAGANPNAKLEKKLWFRGLAQDPVWVDSKGATPLWRAAQASDIAAMKLLAAHGADANAATAQGVTPLMVSAGIGWMANHSNNAPGSWLPAVEFCLEHGANVNAVDTRGYTPLHGAAYIGNNEMVNLLLSKGANIKAKTKSGDTVADMANGPTRFGLPHPETVVLLERLGSENSHNCRSDQCLVAPRKDPPKPAAGAAQKPEAPTTPAAAAPSQRR